MISNSAAASFAAHPAARQFVKFCIVGASSAAIDFGLLNLLHYRFEFPVAAAATLSFFTAVCNGFYWNRRWTFRAHEGKAAAQAPKFVLTNIIGWVLNLGIMTAALIMASSLGLMHTHRSPGQIVQLIATGQGRSEFSALTLNASKALATVIVTAWNFTASKLWTFKS